MNTEEFSNFVKSFIDSEGDIAILFLSSCFEVAGSTVVRWTKGIARPHPLLQAQIIGAINNYKVGK